ncbi:LysR substrate-binding domain-containing protein [Pseudochelatococcus contaminans]|uniref:DNA-binding transcriptional LysR family regulator n=1 Tax=Pseudochelatococcus contaminans TaxID=1538103 RepID=A0A7W6EI10_9HYPH|nr:LysR family transcriptional regulator [Pseudochelatococcus contaminans]MBB3810621.1 DNA-binding transcriptional LysR family regulator [Pseudochelatococcus contaminans]
MLEQFSIVDTDELKTFDVVATKRSFSVASEVLECSQSTISQRIARLEKRVGRRLIFRTTRQVNLTPDGEAMLIYARSILSIAENARLSLMRPSMKGTLRVGVEDEFATTKLPQVLGLFRAQFPHFGMRLITGRNEHLHDILRSHEVDIILGKSHGDQLNSELLWEEELIWVGWAAELLKDGELVPLVSYLNPSITRSIAEGSLRAAGRGWVTVAESSNLLGLLAGAQAGFGIMAIGRSFSTPGLTEISEDFGLPLLGKLHYVLDGRLEDTDEAVDAFISVLKGAAKQIAAVKDDPAPSKTDE